MITFNIAPAVKQLQRRLDDFAARQVPFASARAVTQVARTIARDETALLPTLLDRPTPFTQRAYAVIPGTKARPIAIVGARPIQAAYLAPEEFGEPQKVKGVALVRAVNARPNQYGNLPRGMVARLKARPDVFVGTVDGVGGFYQRIKPRRGRPASLKLLIKFTAPVVPKVRLGFRARALASAQRLMPAEMARQLAAALKTAR